MVRSGSASGFAPTVTDGHRYPGSDTGSASCEEFVTASGGRDSESSVAGRESSGVDGIREDATVIPLWAAANAAASSSDGTGTAWFVFRVGSLVMLRLGARLWMNPFHLCSRDGGRRKLRGDSL